MPDAIATPPVAPATLATPATPPAPAPKTPEQQNRIKAFFDKSIGTTTEEALAAAKKYKAVEGQVIDQQLTKRKKVEEPAPEPTPEPTPPPADPKPDATDAPKEPETPADPKPKKPVRRRQEPADTQADDDRIAQVAADAATRALAAQQPKAPDQPAAPKPEDTLSRAEKRQLATLQEMERLNPEKKGVAKAYTEAIAARAQYEANWLKEHPGQKFDDNAPEHSDFFEGQEARLTYTDDEFDEANEARIARAAREQVQSERQEQETAAERRLRAIEERDNITATAAQAESQVLALIEVEALDKVDEVDRPVVKRALDHAKAFSTAAYSLINGIEAQDLKNPIHREVREITDGLLDTFAAMPKQETINDDGLPYATPEEYYSMTPQQQARHWTLRAIDVIEFQTNKISKNIKGYLENEQKKFTARAEKLGFKVEKPAPKATAPPKTPTPTPPPQQRKSNAPSLGSEVKPTAPGGGGPKPELKGREALKQRWGL